MFYVPTGGKSQRNVFGNKELSQSNISRTQLWFYLFRRSFIKMCFFLFSRLYFNANFVGNLMFYSLSIRLHLVSSTILFVSLKIRFFIWNSKAGSLRFFVLRNRGGRRGVGVGWVCGKTSQDRGFETGHATLIFPKFLWYI